MHKFIKETKLVIYICLSIQIGCADTENLLLNDSDRTAAEKTTERVFLFTSSATAINTVIIVNVTRRAIP